MLSVRGGSGLGDALYIQAIARYLIERGETVEACSDWPDIFSTLGPKVKVAPFRRTSIDRLAHYSMRRTIKGTTQFEDCCIQAGVPRDIPLRLNWTVRNTALVDRLKGEGGPIVLVQMPRAPFGRSDGFGLDLLPEWTRLQQAIDALGSDALKVMVGSGQAVHAFTGIDIDLTNKTSVSDLLDVASVADGFLGYCSFFVPLAECFDKPALLFWSSRGLRSREYVIRQMTPEKVISKPSCRFVIDDCSGFVLTAAVCALLESVRAAALV